MKQCLHENTNPIYSTLDEVMNFSPREIIDSYTNMSIGEIIKHVSLSRGIVDYEEIKEWKVHYIYRMIDQDQKKFILKIRRDHLYAQKEIKKNPWDIEFEVKAYELLYKYSITPKLIDYNKKEHYIFLDSFEWSSLNDKLEYINQELIKSIANVLKTLHTKLSNSFIRPPEKENQIYKNQLFYRFWFLRDKQISKLIFKMSQMRNGIIHGDLNPFNIFIGHHTYNVKLIDLETVHYWNIEFDIWYFIAHLLIFIKDSHTIKNTVECFFDEYALNNDLNLDQDMIIKVLASTLLYRLKSDFSYWEWDKKVYMTQIAHLILFSDINNINTFKQLL